MYAGTSSLIYPTVTLQLSVSRVETNQVVGSYEDHHTGITDSGGAARRVHHSLNIQRRQRAICLQVCDTDNICTG